ncbi:hypothetical protein K474DRAFT_1658227 [Panus rudis PR-1116 ss-1]|nr:hypothetical protein K474DRAFT_1658227 [Panus rudis PR-1116 ss-1]
MSRLYDASGNRSSLQHFAIVELILYHLRRDKKALKTCSLVHRTWLPTARLYLFRHLSIILQPQVKDMEELVQMLRNSAMDPYWPAVGPAIQNLSLKRPQGPFDWGRGCPVDAMTLARVFFHTVNLRTLTLNDVFIVPARFFRPVVFEEEVEVGPVNLVRLSLVDIRVRETSVYGSPLDAVLGLFGHIEDLEIYSRDHRPLCRNAVWFSRHADVAHFFSPPPNLCIDHLHLTMICGDHPLNRVLSALIPAHQLTTLYLSFATDGDIRAARRIFKDCAPTLTHLGLNFRRFRESVLSGSLKEPTQWICDVQVPAFQQLKTVSLYIGASWSILGWAEPYPHAWEAAITILGLLPKSSTSLEEIVFDILESNEAKQMAFVDKWRNWRFLNDIIGQFKGLPVVTFASSHDSHVVPAPPSLKPEVRCHIRKKMPTLQQQGRLSI